MQSFFRELRQGCRSLARRRAYFATAAATLTLVLAANTAIFSVINATLLRPMPFAAAGEIVQLYSQPPNTTAASQRNPLQQMELPRLRERLRTLTQLEGFLLSERAVTTNGRPEVARAAAVTIGLVAMLDAPIAQGRAFLHSEGGPDGRVAIVTHDYWRDTLGGRNVLGEPLVIDEQPHTIVGILAPSFSVPFLNAEILTPLYASPEPQPRSPPRSVVAFGELAAGASLDQAREELARISREFASEFPRSHVGWTLGAQMAREWQYGSLRAPLLLLLAAAAFVQLIACANVASLASAQSVSRSGEIALRRALGGTARDIRRMHFAELLIVCGSGLLPGLVLAWATLPALLAINPTVARTLGAVDLDWRVLVFTVAVVFATAAAASSVPAFLSMRRSLTTVIAAGDSRTTGSPASARVQRILISVEVGLSVALVMAGMVVLQGLNELAKRGPGYRSAGVLTAQIRLPDSTYPTPERRAAMVDRMLDRIRQLPGVTAASTTFNNFVPGFSFQTLVTVKDHPSPDGQPHTVQFRRVSTQYFETMGIRIRQGRSFTTEDGALQLQVAIVSHRFAERLLPPGDPIGRVLVRPGQPRPVTIVGVVDDVFDVSMTNAIEPTLYLPFNQNNVANSPVAFVIRTSVDADSIVPQLRAALREEDPTLPLRRVQLLQSFVDESTAPERFRSSVLGIVTAIGLLLAAVGVSGLTYRRIVDRAREFAVRLALGSGPWTVLGLVLRESARDLAVGIAAGLAVGALVCAVLESSLEHVGRVDVFAASAAVIVMAIVGIVAAALPAHRALRVQPADALRA